MREYVKITEKTNSCLFFSKVSKFRLILRPYEWLLEQTRADLYLARGKHLRNTSNIRGGVRNI